MKVPEFMLSWSEWRHGDGPFVPHPVFPDGFYWHKMSSGQWAVQEPGGIVIKESDWMRAKEFGKVGEFTSIEDTQPAPHIFDVINYWPQAYTQCLGTKDLPLGWQWKWFNNDWVLTNGTIGLTRNDWEKYNNKMVPAQPIGTKADDNKKSGLHSEVSRVEWPEGTPDGYIAIYDNITQTIRVVPPNYVSREHEEKLCVKSSDPATAKQATPKGSGNPILGMVLADLTNRAIEGKEKYGEPLLAHNGRNPLWDAYQEALDLAMYLRQAIEEQKQ